MSQIYDFIKACGTFWVLTVNNGKPAGRPFGAIIEHDKKLYITTSKEKSVYKQITVNPNIQLIALQPNTRNWLRADGEAVECNDFALKQKMLEICPVLRTHFTSAEDSSYALFGVKVTNFEFK